MTTGKKFDHGKLRWSLIPPHVIPDMVRVLEYGAKKYGEHNWREVPNAEIRYYDAAMRHIELWLQGEKEDEESGSSHLAHAMCCISFLMWLEKQEKKL